MLLLFFAVKRKTGPRTIEGAIHYATSVSLSSANLMAPHAENRMAPLNAKTILIIDESNKGKGSAIVFELHR